MLRSKHWDLMSDPKPNLKSELTAVAFSNASGKYGWSKKQLSSIYNEDPMSDPISDLKSDLIPELICEFDSTRMPQMHLRERSQRWRV